jgi:hypothetical protein
MRRLALPFLAALAFPLIAAAAASTTSAGFAPSLWLSKAALTEGDAVKVSTTVYNATSEAIDENVSFLVDDAVIGAKPVSLAAGASAIVSIDWKAAPGTHSLSARITDATGKTTGGPVAVADATAAVEVAVASAPPPPAALAAAGAAANALGDALSDAAPTVLVAAKAVADATESVRAAGEEYFAAKAGISDGGATTAGAVLGAETQRAETGSPAASAGSGQSTYRALYRVFASPALFYPVLLVLLLALLWFVVRRLSRSDA